jgi:D-inositol-3-phosphate glycosyltransferase
VPAVAILSMHTSPLAQPGAGDGGGMNVYVRELSSALTRAGIECDVFTRAETHDAADVVTVEPGLRVHHVTAGPRAEVPKDDLPAYVDTFADGVRDVLTARSMHRVEAIHANYWLSGVAGHRLKHDLGLPLVSTFHTLARVKAETSGPEPEERTRAEAQIIGCSDAILASCADEAAQLVRLYDADPARIELVPPGVEHAFFSPGPRAGARSALGLGDHPVLLFVGRIQPLKGVDVAVAALAALGDSQARAAESGGNAVLVVVGGASGVDGPAEVERVHKLCADLGVADRVRFVDPQPHHLLSTYYRAADVVLVPSRSESFGLVALEAAACGAPVVASAVGGLRTLVDHGHTGFLVEGRDPSAFAAYVAEVLDNPQLASSLGDAAAARARRYTWSTSAARLRRLYADLGARRLVECA